MTGDVASEHLWALVSLLGLSAQIGITVLLWVFFLLLRRHGGRRARFFVLWSQAWLLLIFALLTLAFGFYVLPQLTEARSSVASIWVPAAYLGYQLGKLGFLLLLLAGVFEYLTGRISWWLLIRAGGIASIYAFISFGFSHNLTGMLLWQAAVCIAVYGYCAVKLAALPASRRTLGTRVTAGTLFATALLWCFYGAAFLLELHEPPRDYNRFVMAAADYNSYFDLLLQMLLAFGMVLLLLEEARRETDAAHTELALAHEKLKHDSYTDPLTGVFNRLAFTRGVLLAGAGAGHGAVALFDLDNLKDVNDRLGHEAGDELLRHCVAVVRAGLRPADQLYRWGGDEFLLVMPGANFAGIGPRLNALLNESLPCRLTEQGVELKLRASFGGADYSGADDLRIAVKNADRAMYAHKRSRKLQADGAYTDGSAAKAGSD